MYLFLAGWCALSAVDHAASGHAWSALWAAALCAINIWLGNSK